MYENLDAAFADKEKLGGAEYGQTFTYQRYICKRNP